MKTILYSYAYDAEKKIVNVAKAEKGKNYFCIGCGCEMVLKAGKRNRRHFAHKTNVSNCSEETYLHQLAKKKIAALLGSNKKLIAKYRMEQKCSAECPLALTDKCNWSTDNSFLISEFYKIDEIEVEAKYQNFKPDILLRDNRNGKDPIFIEIEVTHSCDEEKLQSGIRIIEIKIKDEKDIEDLLLKNEIVENKPQRYGAKTENGCVIKFYNFKNNTPALPDLKHQRPLFYGKINNDGTCLFWHSIRCLQIKIDGEYCIVAWGSINIRDLYRIALSDGFNARNCYTCRFCEIDDVGRVLCKLYKKLAKIKNPHYLDGKVCKEHRYLPLGDIADIWERNFVAVYKKGERWDYSL